MNNLLIVKTDENNKNKVIDILNKNYEKAIELTVRRFGAYVPRTFAYGRAAYAWAFRACLKDLLTDKIKKEYDTIVIEDAYYLWRMLDGYNLVYTTWHPEHKFSSFPIISTLKELMDFGYTIIIVDSIDAKNNESSDKVKFFHDNYKDFIEELYSMSNELTLEE